VVRIPAAPGGETRGHVNGDHGRGSGGDRIFTGALLLKLLHITPGAVAASGSIILALLAVRMALGPGDEVVKEIEAPTDPHKLETRNNPAAWGESHC
jgi:hypothetical protein